MPRRFRARFETKGRFTAYLAEIPVFCDPRAAFAGVAGRGTRARLGCAVRWPCLLTRPDTMLHPDAIAALVTADHGDPFAILGVHVDEEGRCWLRALLPAAVHVEA